ncbi:hypothetical protein PQR34_44800 [Paraburkholderia sediminicola]|uniref:hypothetical protein n=1 Tax=Paraburkholderia sediminicola TaxID=458836 RepID=UPI0038BAA814
MSNYTGGGNSGFGLGGAAWVAGGIGNQYFWWTALAGARVGQAVISTVSVVVGARMG